MIQHNFQMHYDEAGDVLYVDITPSAAAYSKPIDDNRVIDYDAINNPVGIEFFNVSEGIDLSSMPHEEQLTTYLEETGTFKIYA